MTVRAPDAKSGCVGPRAKDEHATGRTVPVSAFGGRPRITLQKSLAFKVASVHRKCKSLVVSNSEDTLESSYSSWATAAVRACRGFVPGTRCSRQRRRSLPCSGSASRVSLRHAAGARFDRDRIEVTLNVKRSFAPRFTAARMTEGETQFP